MKTVHKITWARSADVWWEEWRIEHDDQFGGRVETIFSSSILVMFSFSSFRSFSYNSYTISIMHHEMNELEQRKPHKEHDRRTQDLAEWDVERWTRERGTTKHKTTRIIIAESQISFSLSLRRNRNKQQNRIDKKSNSTRNESNPQSTHWN